METIIIQPDDRKQAETVKAFLKAGKIRFETRKDNQSLLKEELREAFQEMNPEDKESFYRTVFLQDTSEYAQKKRNEYYKEVLKFISMKICSTSLNKIWELFSYFKNVI